jgi:hypothetical protein
MVQTSMITDFLLFSGTNIVWKWCTKPLGIAAKTLWENLHQTLKWVNAGATTDSSVLISLLVKVTSMLRQIHWLYDSKCDHQHSSRNAGTNNGESNKKFYDFSCKCFLNTKM